VKKKIPIKSIEKDGGFAVQTLIKKVYEVYKKEVEGYLFLSINGFTSNGNEIYACVE
jgi:hypothetical protein